MQEADLVLSIGYWLDLAAALKMNANLQLIMKGRGLNGLL